MNVQLTKSILAGAVANAVKLAGSEKSTLAVLKTLLLATEGNSLKVVATNLSQSGSFIIPCEVSVQGACCVDAKDFADWVAAVEGDITLELKEAKLTAKAGGNKTKFVIVNPAEFPPIPTSDGEPLLTIPVGQWRRVANSASFASVDDARPVLQGINLSLNDSLKVTSTDGFRLMILEIKEAKVENPISAVVPAQGIKRLNELMPKTLDTPVLFWLCQDRAIWKFENTVLVSSTINGTFPQVDAIIPKTSNVQICVMPTDLLKAIKPVGVVARDANNVLRVDMVNGTGDTPAHLHLSATAEETGSGESDCVVKSTSTGWEKTCFNLHFFQECLEKFQTEVTLDWKGPRIPLKMTSVADPGLMTVLMPVDPGKEDSPEQNVSKQNAAAEKSAAVATAESAA